jgi:hypothetical protein
MRCRPRALGSDRQRKAKWNNDCRGQGLRDDDLGLRGRSSSRLLPRTVERPA